MKASISPEPTIAPATNVAKQRLGQNDGTKLSTSLALPIQTKLTVGAPDDPLEREADFVADKVMQMPANNVVQRKCETCENGSKIQENKEDQQIHLRRKNDVSFLQRKCTDCEEQVIHRKPVSNFITPFVQAKAGGATTTLNDELSTKIENSHGAGSELDDPTKSFMEHGFGADFSAVKIHTGADSIQMNRQLNAQAFTSGKDIYFDQGKYEPDTEAGKKLLAHELTHVVQQGTATENTPVQPKLSPGNPSPLKRTDVSETTGSPMENKGQKEKLNTKEQSGLKTQANAAAPPGDDPRINKATAATKSAPALGLAPTGSRKQSRGLPQQPGKKEAPVVGIPKPTGKIAATAAPSGLLLTLPSTPASQLPETLNQVKITAGESKQLQKAEAAKLLPVVPESMGSAYGEAGGKAKYIAPKVNANVKNKFEGKGQWAAPVLEEVKLPGPATFRPSNLSSQFAGAQASATISSAAQRELDNVSLDTDNLPEKLENSPELELSGEANVSNIAEEQEEQYQDVLNAKMAAAKEIQNDFGENDVIKKPGNALLKTKHQLKSPKAVNTAQLGTGLIASPEMAARFDASLAGQANLKIGAQTGIYLVEEDAYHQQLTLEKTKTDEQIQTETLKSKTNQNKAHQDAQKQVNESRIDWQNQLNKTESDFSSSATGAANQQINKINEEVRTGNAAAKTHYDEANKEANEKTVAAKKEAEDEKKKSNESSGGFFGWLADAASAAINALKKAVNFIFDKLRAALKWVFEKAKKLALAALELARKAVVGLIKGFGVLLKGFVDIAFAAFPSIRDAINQKIDNAVDTAVSLTNEAFDKFKKAVVAIIDTFSEIVDTVLAVVQEALDFALSAIEVIVVGFLKVMAFLNDIEKQYELFKSLIDGFMLIWDHPEILEAKAKEFLEPYIQEIPGSTQSELTKALAFAGLATAKHITGIMKYLTPNINHLVRNWWGEAKKMVWFLIWPFAEGSPLWEDAPKLWRLIPQMWNDLWHGEFSKVIDGGLEWMQALNMTIGAFAGWLVIGGAAVGAILGGIFGVGAGAIPGAGAGFEVGVAIGEGIMVSMIATESAVILKAVYDLATTVDDGQESEPSHVVEQTAGEAHESEEQQNADGPRQYASGQVKTGRDRILYAYQRIANSALTLGIMVALLLLGAIGGKIAQGLLAGLKKLGTVVGRLLPELAEGAKGLVGAVKESNLGKGIAKTGKAFGEGRENMKGKISSFKEKLGLGKGEKPALPEEELPAGVNKEVDPLPTETEPITKPEPKPEPNPEPKPEAKAAEAKPEPEPETKLEADGETKTPDQQKAEDFAKKAQNDEGVVNKGETKDGHKLKSDREGHIVECTECAVYEVSHRNILDENPDLADELREIRKRMTKSPEDPAVMKDLEAFDKKMKEAENFEKAKQELLDNTEKIDEAYEEYKAKKRNKGIKDKDIKSKQDWLEGKLNEETGNRKGGYKNTLKGRVGEYQADVHLSQEGFHKLSNDGKLVELNDPPQGKGLDGVWEKDGELYVSETKYGTSRLTKEQMTDAWIRKQLDYLKDTKLRAKIEKAMEEGALKKILVEVDDRGLVTKTIIKR